MGKEITILRGSSGLNTHDHPSELGEGGYLAKAVNVDISDKGAVSRRSGVSVVDDGYTAAHSLVGFLDRFAIFADGTNLFRYDSEDGLTTAIVSTLTAELPISYTVVGDMLVYSNGVDRGVITATVVADYDVAFPFEADDHREVAPFPLTDMVHFFNGSMYGAVGSFLYCSDPYKINCYDQVKGYILLGSPIRWINSLGGAGVIVGTDKGITAFIGTSIADFKEKVISIVPSILCSDYLALDLVRGNGPEINTKGVLTIGDKGISFLTSQSGEIEDIAMTSKLDFNWSDIKSGAFAQTNNSYIFSGVT